MKLCAAQLSPEAGARLAYSKQQPSVAKSQRNVAKGYEHYPGMARQHSMVVLMANSVGPSDDFIGAGQSAAWNKAGQLVANMDAEAEGVVVFDTVSQEGRVVALS